MVRAVCVFSLLALLFVGIYADFGTNITAVSNNGFDVIVLDSPAWATHIQRSYATHEFFVFGEQTLRTISSGPNLTDFFAQPVTENFGGWNFPLLDLHTVFYNASVSGQNTTVRLTMGVADYYAPFGNEYANALGPYIPLFSVAESAGSDPVNAARIQKTVEDANSDFTGFLTYGIRVDPRNIANNDIVTYLAGFVVRPDNQTGLSVAFGVTRTHYNPFNGIGAGARIYRYNSSIDWFPLYYNKFTAFSSTNRPFVHYFPNFNISQNQEVTYVVVIDPNTQSAYGINIDQNQFPPSQYSFGLQDSYDVVSNSIDQDNQIIFVGLATSGFAPGTIVKLTFTGGIVQGVNFNLPANYSNPKALTNDGTYLYVGMNGYSEVLKLDYAGNVVGYQRLPDYLHRNWDAVATDHHVYFITYEQNSKVYRVSKNDFCPSACPYNGFCKSGACVCSQGYVMNSAKSECLMQAAQQIISIKHHYTVAHDGEIVLGVFFALAVIVAAAGWFQWYKARRSAYQAV